VARRLLLWAIRDPAVEAILGDIEEGYAAGRSRLWYWSQTLGAALSWWRRSLRGSSLRRDLRVALRKLRLRPGFSIVVVTMLALGIGANAAIFSVVNGVLLSPLPYDHPDRLVVVRTDLPEQGVVNARSSGPEYADVAREARSLESVGGIWYRPAALTDDATEPEDIDMAFVTAGFFPTLRVATLLGRHPLPEEDDDGGEKVIVLSEDLWQRRYGGDPGIIGKRVAMDDEPHTVVGVMPASFRMHLPPDVGMPAELDAWVPFGGRYDAYRRTWRIFTLVGRLREDASRVDANAELSRIAAALRADNGEYAGSGYDLRVEALDRSVVAGSRPLLLLLLGAVGLLLLIVCANVANLYLARAGEAHRELVVRRALGASRAQLLRSLAIESAVVTALGATLGVVLARWSLQALPLIAPAELPRVRDITLDLRVAGFAIVLAAITAVLFAGLSATALRRESGSSCLPGQRATGSAGASRLRGGLLVAELGLSLMLLIGVGLMVRSFSNLAAVDSGFDADDVTTIKLSLVDTHFAYAEPHRIAGFYRRLSEQVAALPGVEAAGVTSYLPSHTRATSSYAYEADGAVTEWGAASADYRHVTPGWMEAIGARLLAGRPFTWGDDLDHPNVVIIDDKLADRAWPGEDPIGERLRVEVFTYGDWTQVWAEVVGVVQHMRHDPAREGIEQVFLPHGQSPMRTTVLTIRGGGTAATLGTAVGEIVHGLDGDQPVGVALPMSVYLDATLATRHFALTLLSIFSALALLLALVGAYGVIAYGVSQRTREIGIQMAIGATPTDVVRNVVAGGLRLGLVGIAFGIAGAVALGRFITGMLYGVEPTDPLTFAVLAAVMALVTLAACYIPARRAASLDPTLALRQD
jgi:predicted permease